MLESNKERVCRYNNELKNSGLVVLTWGNASERVGDYVIIKPSGIGYSEMQSAMMVVLDLNGRVVEGDLRPSSDTKTHLELYRKFPEIGSVIHTHSRFATVWAQIGRNIPVHGTTHADCFYGSVPCTRALTAEEVESSYELNTGKVIVELVSEWGIENTCAALVKYHGPFVWGSNLEEALANSIALEEIATMAWYTESFLGHGERGNLLPQYVQDLHFFRKHGENAYYGQE